MAETFFESPESISNDEFMKILTELFTSATGRMIMERYQKAEIQSDDEENPDNTNESEDSSVYLA